MIISINNKKYDITEFLSDHPGGSNVFIDGKDMTKEFYEINHSKNAINMLKKYYIGDVSNNENIIENKEIKKENIINNLEEVTFYDFFATKFNTLKISKLFTHEDKGNIHKTLGFITLINIFYFIFDLFYSGCTGNMTLRKPNLPFMILLWLQILLGNTSLQFQLPTKYNKTHPIMSQEYRLLAILFTLRSISIATIIYFFGKNVFSHLGMIFVAFLTMYLANLINKYYKDKEDNLGAKIGSYPFWTNCSWTTKEIIKTFYSFGSIVFTNLCINNFTTIELNFYVACALQFTAFLYTLSKKNIINTFQWHVLYMIEVILPAFIFFKLFWKNKSILPISLLLFLCRTKINFNKFFMWGIYSILLIFYKYIDKKKNNIFMLLFIIIVFTILSYYNNSIRDKPRKPHHDKVILNKNVNSCNIIKILLSFKPEFNYGQYFNIYVDKEKKPYTPIDYSNNIVTFYIKDYGKNTFSNKICKEYYKNKPVVVRGSFGKSFYVKKEDYISINNKKIEKKNILLFCCGTGITPFYSVLKNINSNTKYNFYLFASFKDKKDSLLLNKIKNKNIKTFLSKENNKISDKKLNNIFKKFNNENSCVFSCGTKNYNNLIKKISIENKFNYNKW